MENLYGDFQFHFGQSIENGGDTGGTRTVEEVEELKGRRGGGAKLLWKLKH